MLVQSKSERPEINRQFIRRLYIYIYISVNFKCSKIADHILEMAGLGLFCSYRFINYICKIILLSEPSICELVPGLSE